MERGTQCEEEEDEEEDQRRGRHVHNHHHHQHGSSHITAAAIAAKVTFRHDETETSAPAGNVIDETLIIPMGKLGLS